MTAAGPYVPFEHWPDTARKMLAAAYVVKADAASGRIRELVRTARCGCAIPASMAADGRCSRCWGWPA